MPASIQRATLAAEAGGGYLFHLDDDAVKLVSFFIVSLRRDHERIVMQGIEIVPDSRSYDGFVAEKIARYMQSLKPPIGDIEKDRQYLRVFFTVVRRWPRAPMKFEEREVAVLEEIAQQI